MERAKDWRRAAELLSRSGTARDPAPVGLRTRQGVVTVASAADVLAGVCTILLGGDTETPIVGVACLASYRPVVGDVVWVVVNGTDLLVIGRQGWDGTHPYAEATGQQSITCTAALNSAAVGITFPAGRFTVAPRVFATVEDTTIGCWAVASAVTTSGCNLTLHLRASGTSTRAVNWHARQATPTSADG